MKKWTKALPVLFAALMLVGVLCLAGCGKNEARAEEVNTDALAGIVVYTEAAAEEAAEEVYTEAAEEEAAEEVYAEEADAEAAEEVLEVNAVIDMSTIPEGIYIGDVYVGGMTAAQARAAIREYVEAIAQQPVTLAANDLAIKTTVTEIGFKEDVEATIQEALNYGKTGNVLKRYKELKDLETEEKVLPLALTADEDQVREFLESHIYDLSRSAVDYGLTREGGEFVITEGQTGQYVNVDESVEIIMTEFAQGWKENTTISLPVDVLEPRGSVEELSMVTDVLGKFSTDYSSSSSARKTNIMVGTSCIDGALIYPGETYSVESAVTPFDEAHGYAEAPSYESGSTVDTYGGGICQVSTTLYNAVIRAELTVVERHGHSMTVSYVDPSDDAAIAEGIKDLKFTNNTDAPIYISGYTDGATCTFTVYGHETRPSNRSLSFVSEVTSTEEPTVEYQASSESFGYIEQVQSSHSGMTAELWKIVMVDGVEESRELFNTTTYTMYPAIYEVGVNTENTSAMSALYDAIATQDINTIYATIAAYSYTPSTEETTYYDDYSDEYYDTEEVYEDYSTGEETYDTYYEDTTDYTDYSDYTDYGDGGTDTYYEEPVVEEYYEDGG